MFEILQELREATAARARAITRRYPDWPCRQGCAACCRSLAQRPVLPAVEWREVAAGLALLPESTRAAIEERLAALDAQTQGPFTCGYLDPEGDSCLIYANRPLACRAYGFYADERGVGLYCGKIREKVEAGEYAEAVWGNHSALEERLSRATARPDPTSSCSRPGSAPCGPSAAS